MSVEAMKRELEVLEATLRSLYRKYPPGKHQSEQVLKILAPLQEDFRRQVLTGSFASDTDEIHYFKYIKPRLVSLFIYHHKLLHLELNLPKGSLKQLKKYYHLELDKVTAFFMNNAAFIRYVRSGDNRLDRFYFLRGKATFHDISESIYAEIDPNYTTYYDIKLSRLFAYERLDDYLKSKLHQLKTNPVAIAPTPEPLTVQLDSLPRKDQLLKSHQVERLLGISTSTLHRLRKKGILPGVKVGGILFYREEDILKLLQGGWKLEAGD